MKPFDPVTVVLVVGGCIALNVIKDPMEYLGACAVYGVLLGLARVAIHDIYGDDDES